MVDSSKYLILLLSATLLIGGAESAEPTLKMPKASRAVIERLATQTTQDVIVVFDESAIVYGLKSTQSETDILSSQTLPAELKAERFTTQKSNVLAEVGVGETSLIREYSHLPMSFLRISSKEALAKLIAHPGVLGVYEDRVDRIFLAESLPLISQPAVSVQGYAGTGVSVAVLDTGVDYTRAAFGSCSAPGVGANCRVVATQGFAVGDGQLDSHGHGTNVSGIVAGVAPGATIVSLRVCSASGSCKVSDGVAAVNYAIQNKATYNIVAMNLSLGGGKLFAPTTSDPYYAAFANARAAGIVPVVASGNDTYTNALATPGAVVGAVSVGAVYDSAIGGRAWRVCTDGTTATDKVTCFSNSASFLTLLAPGSEILAAGLTESGTSQATPHVAGAAAVLRAAFPNESVDTTVARLTNGDLVTDARNDLTKPRLNMVKAMALTASCSFSVSPTEISASSAGISGSVSVSAPAGCAWQAVGNSVWISVTSAQNGSGNGTIAYTIAANPNVASRIGSITVGGHIIAVTQSGSSAGSSNILFNGDFEAGNVGWVQSTANALPIITANLTPTNNNRWNAWFCGYDNCLDQMYQDVTIPLDAQSADLRYSFLIDTLETAVVTAYDTIAVQIFSPPNSATPSATCGGLSNLNAGTTWTLSSNCSLFSFRGQTVRIRFSAATDSSLYTNFYIDDVSVLVSGSALADTQAPSQPAGLVAAVVSATQVSLSWFAASDNVAVATYKVFSGANLLGSVGNFPGATVSQLSPSTNYTFSIAACDAANNCSAPSASVTITTPQLLDLQAPSVPAGLSAIPISTDAISVAWGPSGDNVAVTSYRLFRGGVLIASLGSATNYLDTGLRASTSYSYSVAACDASANCSAQSLPVSATTLSPVTSSTPVIFSGPSTFQVNGGLVNIFVTKIQNTSFTRTSGSLRLELWALNAVYTYSNGASGYRTASIRTSSIQGASDQLLPNVSFNNTNLNLTYTAPATGFTNYTLFLLEYNPANCSAADGFCVIDYLNYHENAVPTVPSSLTAVATGATTVNLNWQPSSDNVGVVGYNVYRSGIWIAALGVATSYADTNLTPSTTYFYEVAACDAVNNCSARSIGASATTLSQSNTTVPTIPTSLNATIISSAQVNLTWGASTDAVGVTAYKIYSSGVLVGTVGNVTSSIRNTLPSTTYTYTVAACNFAGSCSAPSLSVTLTTPSLTTQTITFGPLSDRVFGVAPFSIAAIASSGLAVTFTSTTQNACSMAGSTVSIVAAGVCTIVASQLGSAVFAPATAVTQSFNVQRAQQTITFGNLAGRTLAESGFSIGATASSGLLVQFTSQTPSICATTGPNGASITLLAPGTCTIAADQVGNASYFAAAQVVRTFSVSGAVVPGAPSIGTAIGGNGQALISFSAPASDGGSPILRYVVNCGGVQVLGNASPISVGSSSMMPPTSARYPQ